MPDEVQKGFVRSFVTFLKSQIGSGDMADDAQESVEVAIQCLQAAFDIEEDEAVAVSGTSVEASGGAASTEAAGKPKTALASKKVDLFELFQSIYVEQSSETSELAESIKNQGNRLMEEGKYNEALLQYNRAIAFNPKNPIYYCNRAAAHIRLGDNERAVTDCKSALVYNTSYSKAYGRLGIAYSNLGKYEEAEQAYSKAIELEPNNQDYKNNLEVARNARTQTPVNSISELTSTLNAMLSNPAIRNIFSSADINLDQLHRLSQNPVVMNALGQMFPTGETGAAGAAALRAAMGAAGPMQNDVLQLFESVASHLVADPRGDRPGNNSGNNNPSDTQPPSS